MLQNMALMCAGISGRDSPIAIPWISGFIDMLGMETSGKKTITLHEILGEVSKELERRTRKIERLYKSVAESKP